MNPLPSIEKLDPDTAGLFEALNVIDGDEICVKQFKTAFLKSSNEVKKQVRSSINSFIETLKEREDKLCQQIDEHILQVSFWKEKSRDSFLLEDSSYFCDSGSQPTLKMKFVNDSGDLERKLQEFGSIQVETINNPVDMDSRKIGCPFGFSASPHTPRASPESTASVESFDVISDSDIAGSLPKPVIQTIPCKNPKMTSFRDLMFDAIEYSFSHPNPKQPYEPPPVTALLLNQLRSYKDDPKLSVASQKSTADSTTGNQQPSPSSIIKEKFGEYLCNSEQEKWLASSSKM